MHIPKTSYLYYYSYPRRWPTLISTSFYLAFEDKFTPRKCCKYSLTKNIIFTWSNRINCTDFNTKKFVYICVSMIIILLFYKKIHWVNSILNNIRKISKESLMFLSLNTNQITFQLKQLVFKCYCIWEFIHFDLFYF